MRRWQEAIPLIVEEMRPAKPRRRGGAPAQAWFSGQPEITIVACDRGGGYALAAATALPNATQVADRWHLVENASRAFLNAVRKSMREIRAAIGATTINPRLLTAAERIQYEGYLGGIAITDALRTATIDYSRVFVPVVWLAVIYLSVGPRFNANARGRPAFVPRSPTRRYSST
jgi:hypothetical protein